jgi:FixJ family two-component response regulator
MKFEHSSRLLAILDDDKSGQSALKDLGEAEGIAALYFSSA